MSDFNIEFEENDQQIKLEFEQIGGGAVKSVNGKTGVVVLDADDVGAYTKPTGGIPKTDLASAVQTSLGKADSAYQKPSGGIPAGDIASGVVPAVDNTLTVSGAAADAKKTGDEISDLKDGLTAVEDDVADVKEDLSEKISADAFDYGYLKSYNNASDWEQGLINITTGNNSPSSAALHAYAIRTKTYIDANALIAFIKHPNQYFRFSVFKYQTDGTFIESVSKQTELTVSAEYKYRLVMFHYKTVSLSNYTAITPAEYNEAGIFSDRNELVADVDTIFYHPVNVVNVDGHYYTTGDGVLHYNYANDFSCTSMIAVNPGNKMRITTACGDSVGVVGYDSNKNRISNIMETGGTALYQVGRGVLTTEITIPTDVYFITVSNVLASETNIIVETSNMKSEEMNPIIPLLIVPDTSERFLVYDRAENGKYLKHRFVKQYYTDTLSYGDGLSKTVVGADVWYSDLISDGTVSVMAGNFNFIHNIGNMEGHNGYVGAGHGCTVADWTIFKADGESFDPTATTKMTSCNEFDFIIKAKNYLIDKPNSPSESHAVPTLDSNGDPIVTSVNTINARMKANNEIEYRNRLIFKMDGIQFKECHGSMCEGYFSAFNNVIVSNSDESWNYLDSENDYAREKMNGTQWDIFAVGSKKALSVAMFGDKYKVENKLIQLDGSRNKITNTRSEIYRTGGARMKIYLMPVVCTISSENIADGATVETFNDGDILDVMSYRKISVS